MKSINYKVCRDDIYVGQVVKAKNVYRHEGKYNLFNTEPGQLTARFYKPCRSMLFIPDKLKLSNDLLYDSPGYLILNITDDELCLDMGPNSIVIKDSLNISELLKYFGYDEVLTYNDIIKIRKTFFNNKFIKNNCELFGDNECSRLKTEEPILPNKYFDVLNNNRDSTLMEVICGVLEKLNAFTPHKLESEIAKGPIKKLTRF